MNATASLRANAVVAFGGKVRRAERSLPRFILGSVLVHSAPFLALLPFALAPRPISRSLASSAASEVAVNLFARSDDTTAAAAPKELADPPEPPEPAPASRSSSRAPR